MKPPNSSRWWKKNTYLVREVDEDSWRGDVLLLFLGNVMQAKSTHKYSHLPLKLKCFNISYLHLSQQSSTAQYIDLPARKRKVLTPEELEERRRKVVGFYMLGRTFPESFSHFAFEGMWKQNISTFRDVH